MATVFGNSGNRWWVGLNVDSDQSNIYGFSSFLSPNGYESLPSGNAADDAKFAAAAKKDAVSGATPVTISVENVNWYNIRGPYATQSAANAAIAAIQKAHPAPGVIQQATAGSQQNAANGGGINPSGWEQGLQGFLGFISSRSGWIRIAEGVIGTLLILSAVSTLAAGTPIGKAVKKIPLL